MTIDLSILCRQLEPQNTTLVLGAGASIPSGAPSGAQLARDIEDEFQVGQSLNFNLADICTLVERRRDRRSLIEFICKKIEKLQPTGGLLSLPRFPWAGIFSTNYDDLVEKSYQKSSKRINVYSSNYDFRANGAVDHQSLYKFHGTLWKDESLGHRERMVVTGPDYDKVEDFRAAIYGRLADCLHTKNVLIVGHSLEDPDLRKLVDDALKSKSTQGAPGRIYLFSYTRNDDLAEIYEARGVVVCFGTIDDLAHGFIKASPSKQLILAVTNDVLDVAPILQPSTLTVSTQLDNESGNLSRMYNGRPASYGDIANEWTFSRDIVSEIEANIFSPHGKRFHIILGAAGVGKTTAARSLLRFLCQREVQCWEHKDDFQLDNNAWLKVNLELIRRKDRGVLFVDDAHHHLRQINKLAEQLSSSEARHLVIILCSLKPHWNPRIKSPTLFSNATTYDLSRLSDNELASLLDLLDSKANIRDLIERRFLGFSRSQRLDRLRQRCDSDMFVCLKNIFGFQSIDSIILEEFNSISDDLQEVYRIIAGMQSIGVRVHREIVRRVTGLQANQVSRTLGDLEGIIEEYEVSARQGIYGWKLRHHLIATIISKYKYASQEAIFELFETVLSHLNPSYHLEVQSIADMCDLETGVVRVLDQEKQNYLLRRMITLAPAERVPRHRLIHNLIDLEDFDTAEGEIRAFEKELRADAPVVRYKIRLKLGLAKSLPGLNDTDRASLVLEALTMSEVATHKYPDDKHMFRTQMDCALDYYKYSRNVDKFERALQSATEAQSRILDPDLRVIISKYSRIGQEIGIYSNPPICKQ